MFTCGSLNCGVVHRLWKNSLNFESVDFLTTVGSPTSCCISEESFSEDEDRSVPFSPDFIFPATCNVLNWNQRSSILKWSLTASRLEVLLELKCSITCQLLFLVSSGRGLEEGEKWVSGSPIMSFLSERAWCLKLVQRLPQFLLIVESCNKYSFYFFYLAPINNMYFPSYTYILQNLALCLIFCCFN